MLCLEALIHNLMKNHESAAAGNRNAVTFPGFKANINISAPRKSGADKKYPWRGCISETWLAENGGPFLFRYDDESVNILKIRVPDDLLSDENDTYRLYNASDDDT
jgi:hypothetical protein